MLMLLLTIGLFVTTVVFQTPDLNALRWNNRVLLLFAPSTNNDQIIQQKQMLDSHSAGLDERDLKVFEITGSSQADEQLRGRFHVKADSFAVVLVGKDGSQKLKRSQPTDPEEVFKLIDSMPMRKEEMRQKQ
ncbi:MAG: DUF4174 domain-containing protein [Acidobacteriaceae bacterium]|nr:DUF4174 domain-containing protein [Acidobacteriaceae bacterium]